ncbi:MAG: DUF3568 family protein [Planctomycetota bacterium]|nr:DUF3568 family protein [Planctomycetota bacterium]
MNQLPSAERRSPSRRLARPVRWLAPVRAILLAAVLGASLAASGCAAKPSPTGEIYRGGKLTSIEPVPVSECFLAAQNALQQLRLILRKKVRDAFDASVVGVRIDGDDVNVHISRIGDDTCRVVIRAGSEQHARVVLRQIRANYAYTTTNEGDEAPFSAGRWSDEATTNGPTNGPTSGPVNGPTSDPATDREERTPDPAPNAGP